MTPLAPRMVCIVENRSISWTVYVSACVLVVRVNSTGALTSLN